MESLGVNFFQCNADSVNIHLTQAIIGLKYMGCERVFPTTLKIWHVSEHALLQLPEIFSLTEFMNKVIKKLNLPYASIAS